MRRDVGESGTSATSYPFLPSDFLVRRTRDRSPTNPFKKTDLRSTDGSVRYMTVLRRRAFAVDREYAGQLATTGLGGPQVRM
jgi:hypothetical protein